MKYKTARNNDEGKYVVVNGTSGYLPTNYFECNSLTEIREIISLIKTTYSEWTYNRWESVNRLRASHIKHAGKVGITVGVFVDGTYSTDYITVYLRED